jgi:hypothetical protein
MKKATIILMLFFMTGSANSQKVNWEKLKKLNPDNVLVTDTKPTKVLLLGTFHFAYPNLDGHKTDSSKFIDVLSPQRQKEIQELADVIKRFKPTRIYIESRKQSFHDSLYREYLADRYKPGRNEIFQLAYRVAKQISLEKLYCVDAGEFASSNYKKGNWVDSMWKRPNPVDGARDKFWNDRYAKFYSVGDSIEITLTMLENFLLMADPAVLARMHGHYMTGGFNTKGDDGPDILSMWWYSRNLRIFNNVLKTQPASEDRIVLLFGNGHMPILKHCFASSPEFEVVELKSLLK